MKVIRNLNDLRVSKFGQPDPRHGLELLYWFSREYIDVDYNRRMKPKLGHPQTGAFGFCRFHNNEEILPKQNLPYYEVGNLNGSRANELPQYVRSKYIKHCDESNKDRIIIHLHNKNIEKVYVTEHESQKTFNSDQTYEVTRDVIEQIRGMKRDQFLQTYGINSILQSDSSWSWCTIL